MSTFFGNFFFFFFWKISSFASLKPECEGGRGKGRGGGERERESGEVGIRLTWPCSLGGVTHSSRKTNCSPIKE